MNQQSDNHYLTSDTALAAFLRTKNFYLIFIDYSALRYNFVFSDSEQIREAANNYLTGNALCDPSSYSRIFKKLNRIVSKKVQWEND
mgnify:CR=1